jgi:hypothetical protein
VSPLPPTSCSPLYSASWEAAQAGAQIVPLYSPDPTGGRHESVVDCLNCQNFADETARGAGYDYYNVGWYINNTDAYFTIKVPPSTTLFELYGATGLKYGRMAVEWDPPLPEDMASAPYVNTHSMWLQYEQLLVMQPLDPRIEYKVTLKNAALMENDPNYNAIDSGATDISVSRYQFFRATE